jgi:hypothetical protein
LCNVSLVMGGCQFTIAAYPSAEETAERHDDRGRNDDNEARTVPAPTVPFGSRNLGWRRLVRPFVLDWKRELRNAKALLCDCHSHHPLHLPVMTLSTTRLSLLRRQRRMAFRLIVLRLASTSRQRRRPMPFSLVTNDTRASNRLDGHRVLACAVRFSRGHPGSRDGDRVAGVTLS